jgi:mannose-6-phosphate isomerase-like protein (cupin superfamily)
MTQTTTQAQFFEVKTPLVQRGGSHRMPLAKTDNIQIVSMCYTEDGEDRMHYHPNEDHGFFVLKGAIIVMEPGGKETRLGPYQGVLMPAEHYYSFISEGDEPVVLLRFGSYTDERRRLARQTEEGEDLEHKQRGDVGLIPGAFFPA